MRVANHAEGERLRKVMEDKKKIWDHITAIHILKESGLKGSCIIGAYHARRVAPLMTRVLLLYAMAPEASLDGTVLAEGALPNSEIAQRIKEAMELSRDDTGAPLNFVYPVLGHPPMWPKLGHIVFVSLPFSCLPFNRFPDLLILTLRGAGSAEGPHLHGSPGTVAERFVREGGESHHGRVSTKYGRQST